MIAPANHMTAKDIVGLGVMSRRHLAYLTNQKRRFRVRRMGHCTLWYSVVDVEQYLGCGLRYDPQTKTWSMYETPRSA